MQGDVLLNVKQCNENLCLMPLQWRERCREDRNSKNRHAISSCTWRRWWVRKWDSANEPHFGSIWQCQDVKKWQFQSLCKKSDSLSLCQLGSIHIFTSNLNSKQTTNNSVLSEEACTISDTVVHVYRASWLTYILIKWPTYVEQRFRLVSHIKFHNFNPESLFASDFLLQLCYFSTAQGVLYFHYLRMICI
jgi:hypothetical protein